MMERNEDDTVVAKDQDPAEPHDDGMMADAGSATNPDSPSGSEPAVPKQPSEALTDNEKRLLAGLGIAAAIVLLVILAVNVFSGDDADGDTDEPAAQATEQPEAPSQAFGADGGIVDTPGALAASTEVASDDFDREGLEGGPLAWSILGEGTWAITDGALWVGGEGEGAPLAVVEVPTDVGDEWQFGATVGSRASGIGLVWGVEDADNYWELRANLDFAALAINRITDGKPEQVKIVGPAGVGDGQTLTVEHIGDTVTLIGNDKPFFSLSDPSLAEPRMVGVIASSGSGVTFTDVTVSSIDGSG